VLVERRAAQELLARAAAGADGVRHRARELGRRRLQGGDQRPDPVQRRAVVERGDRDVLVDLGRTPAELQVVLRHHGAFGVPDQVDLLRAGRGEHPLDEVRACAQQRWKLLQINMIRLSVCL